MGGAGMIQVLLVDDENFVRRGLIQTVPWLKYGLQVAGEASNGKQAIEIIKNKEIDLLFVDLTMPDMTGLELIHRLKDEYPDKSAVILTCHQDFEYAQEAVRLGALDYIVKTQMTRNNIDEILKRILTRYKDQQEFSRTKRYVTARSDDDIRKLWRDGDWIFMNTDHATSITEYTAIKTWFDSHSELLNFFTFPAAKDNGFSEWIENMRKQLRSQAESHSISEDVCKCLWKALLYMIENYGDHINQTDLSRDLGLNRSYFSQMFAVLFNRPFNLVLRDIRMNRAEHLLIHRQQPIYWIAKEVGYQDDKYFSRIFREQKGCLPKEFRERFRTRTKI